MTEEEKKEFEEFLQWKAEKAKREQSENHSLVSEDNDKLESEADREKEKKESEEPNPLSEPQKNNFNFIPIILGVIALFILFFAVSKCSQNNQFAQQPEEEYVDPDTIEEVVDVTPEVKNSTWDFTFDKDPMTDTNNIWATIKSDDYIVQDFPYGGNTYASITVRYMKKYGYDVLIQITKGQINGRSYTGTDYITARFDGGTPKKYYFNEAADGSTETIFIRSRSDFISRCKKAKDIVIDIPIYQNGRPTFSFHVDEPLVWREK